MNRYVYRSERDGERVQRTYLGRVDDPVVQALQRFRELERASATVEQQKTEVELVVAERVNKWLNLTTRASHRIVRNLRRRYRDGGQQRIWRGTMNRVAIEQDDYDELVERVAEGSEEALKQLRSVLEKNPALYRVLGDVNGHVRRHLLAILGEHAPDVAESVKMSIEDKRRLLLREGDTLPEQLLVDQVISTMLDAACCQIGFAQPHRSETIKRRWENRLARAQQRHQAAVQSLVEVWRILVGGVWHGEDRAERSSR